MQHANIKRGHAHEHGSLWHFGNDKLGVKLGQPNHFAAIDQCTMNGHKQTMHMEDGQGVNEHIAFFPAPISLERLRIAQHVAVRQHGAFAATRGATGVQNGGQVVGIFNGNFVCVFLMDGALKQGACAIVIQSKHMLRARLECNFANPTKIGTRTNYHRRLCVANEILNFGALVGGVQRQKHIARTQRCQIQHHGFN